MRIKIVHTADIHAGRHFENADLAPEAGVLLRQEILRTLQEICETVRREAADFLLISGDLTEREIRREDLLRIRDFFMEIHPAQVIWTLGECDGDSEEEFWPDHVHRVPPGFHRLEFAQQHTVIWGESWSQETWPERFFEFVPPSGPDQFHILMLHADADAPASPFHPVDMAELKSLGLDYCALGHRHHSLVWGREGEVWAAYPGSPQALSFQETGEHSYLIAELEKEEGFCIRRVYRKPSGRRQFVERKVTLSPDMELGAITDAIREAFPPSVRRRDFCRAVLLGVRETFKPLPEEKLKQILVPDSFFYLDIRDQTRPELDLDQLGEENRENLLGRYISSMQERIQNAADSQEKEMLREALLAGVEALLGSSGKER